MWLSERFKSKESYAAETGTVTMNTKGCTEAAATMQARNSESYSPYGYSFCAPVGENVLLINSSAGTVSAGVKMKNNLLQQGEILIESLGGAKIALKNNGDIEMNGIIIDKTGNITKSGGEAVEL